MKKTALKLTVLATLLASSAYAETVDLRILETTDLHANMMDYDYYKKSTTERFGYVRTATLIDNARAEVKNSVLVDNGDLIQGSPLADYTFSKGLKDKETHPVHKAMNKMDYVVGNIGNHEFNFGLDFLKQSLKGAEFPYVNSNVFDAKTGEPMFQQYIIVDTPVVDRDGKEHTIKIGYIGFVPPQVLQWDKVNLEGKVTVKDITETAKQLVPQMRKEGADIVIAIPHSGLSSDPYKLMAENSVYYLSEVEGINAIMFGHSHGVFPSDKFSGIKGIDIENGLINGVPAVMPGQWGDHLGVVDLVLDKSDAGWTVSTAKATTRAIFDTINNKSLAEPNLRVVEALKDDHKGTEAFMNKPIGKVDTDLFSHLALVQEDPSIQIIHDAQRDYIEHYIQGDPDLDGLPVLSAVAPFKAGGRKNDPYGYVEVPKGVVSVSGVADIYMYANTLTAVKVKGSDIKEWLECSASLYNQVDVNSTAPQYLLNWDDFRMYNFDSIDGGVKYQIDVTQPARYNSECGMVNDKSERITDLTYNGKPIDPNQDFLIAANNYRAFTGKYAGTGAKNVVINAPDPVKDVIERYIANKTKENGTVSVKLPQNWQLKPISSKTKLDIRLETSPSEKAKEFISKHAQYPMTYVGTDDIGFAIYKIDLQNK